MFQLVAFLLGEANMSQVRYTAEQIIHKLREVDVLIAQGKSVKQACRQCGIADKTYY